MEDLVTAGYRLHPVRPDHRGIYARIAQRLLAMAACIWHNRASGEPVKRPLTAFDN